MIAGIGLSNDGRQSGLLAPAVAGQTRAMTAALEQAGLAPADIDFVDCHATGTTLGDATELESMLAAYGEVPLTLGALKGNLGHTITVSGAASLVNVLSAMQASVTPPTLCDKPTAALKETPFTLSTTSTPWDGTIKRAAVSNFGFGGNNAHLIVQNYVGPSRPTTRQPRPSGDVVICGMGVVTGDARDVGSFRRRALGPPAEPTPLHTVELDLAGLGCPPSELKASLSQQTAMLAAAAQALEHVSTDPERTGVVVGMGCDATIARHRLRVQHAADDEWLAANEDAAPRLTADGVVGTMPNIPANRIHAQRDFRGFGFTVSSEELSGIAALRIGVRALRRGELDTVVAGAVDMCCEPAHARASDALAAGESGPHGDAAVAFVLKRRADAEAAGEEIIAVVDTEGVEDRGGCELRRGTVRPHACGERRHRSRGARGGAARAGPGGSERGAAGAGRQARRNMARVDRRPRRRYHRVCGHRITRALGRRRPFPSRNATQATAGAICGTAWRAANRVETGLCVALWWLTASPRWTALRREAVQRLDRGEAPAGIGVAFTDAPIAGELAFVFTGAAATYPGAGRDLLLAWPEIGDALAPRFSGVGDLARALYGAGIATLDPRAQLTGGAAGLSGACRVFSHGSRPHSNCGRRPFVGRDERLVGFRGLARPRGNARRDGGFGLLRRTAHRQLSSGGVGMGPGGSRTGALGVLARHCAPIVGRSSSGRGTTRLYDHRPGTRRLCDRRRSRGVPTRDRRD